MPDLAVYYEHPDWFKPLFAALDRRGVDWAPLTIEDHVFDPADATLPAPVIFNRLSMSAFLRQSEHAIFYSQAALAHWGHFGARVINGAAAMTIDTSKARQLSLFKALGLEIPATRVVHRYQDIVPAAATLRFPVIVKGNIGGSGAAMTQYDSIEELDAYAADRETPVGLDGVTLVQEFVPTPDAQIIRCETLKGRFLYAVAMTDTPTVEAYEPPLEILEAVQAVAEASHLDVGAVEYMIDARDGVARFFDIDALSPYGAETTAVLGFDPYDKLVDFLEEEIVNSKRDPQ
jgi:hypothetical protein